ncbi:hypothetical protein BACCIP111883_00133 [Sutcliffiella rhizosphaerae]|uniref:Uncharacterized protein n=1 Tax=Sutcliffiella rhizosphaerae TaxID=2880967 RepID=A0ABM8YHQ6_9BACI|nr:hypothetical protein BACCIP111883_00133 [Sutcliffiella rhizosphaerae]
MGEVGVVLRVKIHVIMGCRRLAWHVESCSFVDIWVVFVDIFHRNYRVFVIKYYDNTADIPKNAPPFEKGSALSVCFLDKIAQ